MNSRVLLWSGMGAVGLFGALGAAWIVSLPEPTNGTAPELGTQEADALLAALKPPKRQRPLIAIIGINDATETTDYLMHSISIRHCDTAGPTISVEPGKKSSLHLPAPSSTTYAS